MDVDKNITGLLALPRELVAHILSFLCPAELASFGATCQSAHELVAPTYQILWRNAFLQIFDDPVKARLMQVPSPKDGARPTELEWKWFDKTRERFVALKTLRTTSRAYRNEHMHRSVEVIVEMIETAFGKSPNHVCNNPAHTVSRNIAELETAFETNPDAEKMIHDFHPDIDAMPIPSELMDRVPRTRPMTRSMVWHEPPREAASKLHVYYGVTRREKSSKQARGAARQLVYDWNLSDGANEWGPFKHDCSGLVDWHRLEAVYSITSCNFERLARNVVRPPQGFRYSIPHQTMSLPSCSEDWAGVTGSLIGTYSFLDYTDLLHFNVGYRPNPRPALDDFDEAVGDLMQLTLKLDSDVRSDWRLRTQLPSDDARPVLYFSGTSQGPVAFQPAVQVRGRVSLVPGGRQVRWRFIISYSGGDQWQLEGVQPGGVQSAGIYGLWTHCDREENGPIGPIGPFVYFPSELCDLVGRHEA